MPSKSCAGKESANRKTAWLRFGIDIEGEHRYGYRYPYRIRYH